MKYDKEAVKKWLENEYVGTDDFVEWLEENDLLLDVVDLALEHGLITEMWNEFIDSYTDGYIATLEEREYEERIEREALKKFNMM